MYYAAVAIWMQGWQQYMTESGCQAARLVAASSVIHLGSTWYKVVVAGGPLKFHGNPATTTPSAGLEECPVTTPLHYLGRTLNAKKVYF